ncbi:DUF1674 domain-containing protein [Lutibaculum baratangense]|uniref:DUF1674 domain-containing protein n=1 Tax=Lutibaculum baratangense AMV1 TaxID=631454 RepID=V4RLE0_9HYPH|nr:DUF1674 domain-containing protein [Lutibaculum baratangense]ESR26129.1 hypothetical protein N177_0988 [Lutibaculum baratangense AMV1]
MSESKEPEAVRRWRAEAARRALAEAEERRARERPEERPKEVNGRSGPEPTRYGDWEKKGILSDF